HGYKTSFSQFLYEVVLAHESKDQAYLQRIAEANPDGGEELAAEIIAAEQMNAEEQLHELERLDKEQAGHTFFIPPIVLPEDRDVILSNIGLSSRWGAIYTTNNGPHAAFIRVQLRSGFQGRE